MEKQGKGNNNTNNNEERNMNYPNQFRSIMRWGQQNSPIAWGEMYNEYITYVTSITEIYKEYIKLPEKMTGLYGELAVNTERPTNHGLNKSPKPSSSKEQRKEKQVNRLKDKKGQGLEIIYKQTGKYIRYPHDFTKPLPGET